MKIIIMVYMFSNISITIDENNYYEDTIVILLLYNGR